MNPRTHRTVESARIESRPHETKAILLGACHSEGLCVRLRVESKETEAKVDLLAAAMRATDAASSV